MQVDSQIKQEKLRTYLEVELLGSFGLTAVTGTSYFSATSQPGMQMGREAASKDEIAALPVSDDEV